MNILLKPINIQKIIDNSKKILKSADKTADFECKHPGDLKGYCGLARDIVYSCSIQEGVPQNCIKLLQSADFLRDSSHGFTILILDKLYLCDLTFSQFVANIEELEIIDNKYQSSLKNLYDNGYIEISENNLLAFFIFCSRDLHYHEIEENTYKPIQTVEIFPIKSSGNFLQQVISQTSEEPDYTIEEFEKYS